MPNIVSEINFLVHFVSVCCVHIKLPKCCFSLWQGKLRWCGRFEHRSMKHSFALKKYTKTRNNNQLRLFAVTIKYELPFLYGPQCISFTILITVKKTQFKIQSKGQSYKTAEVILLCHKVICLFCTVTFISELIAKRQWTVITSVTTRSYNLTELLSIATVLSFAHI